tara:strand:- start:5136 stop:5933 length:798 start_codon:yes stop_codon:yes gene_type:complete
MKNLLLENDADFDNAYCGSRCRAEKKLKEVATKRVNETIISVDEIMPDYFSSVNNFALKINNYSLEDVTKVLAKLQFLWNQRVVLKFPNASPPIARGKEIKIFIKERSPIFNAYKQRLEDEKERLSQKEVTRKELFNKLVIQQPFVVKTFNQDLLNGLNDGQIEDSLLLLDEYILFESNSDLAKIYQDKIDKLVFEQNSRNVVVREEEQEQEEQEEEQEIFEPDTNSSVNNNGSSEIKNSLMKYKYYIGGALLIGIIGIVVIKKL